MIRTRREALPAVPAASIAMPVTRWMPRRTCRSDQRQPTRAPATVRRSLPSIQTSVRAMPEASAASARTVARRRRRAWRPGETIATPGAEWSTGGSVTGEVLGGLLLSVVGGCTTGGGGGGGDGNVALTSAEEALLPEAS